jgi:hypothetical protein
LTSGRKLLFQDEFQGNFERRKRDFPFLLLDFLFYLALLVIIIAGMIGKCSIILVEWVESFSGNYLKDE